MKPAPLYSTMAEGPDAGQAYWVHTDDGVRIRLGLWNAQAPKGTVLLMPGRTEYIEKYGRTAADLAGRGYATLAIDWRGQGLADRLLDDPMAGHVHLFTDYQRDVAAMVRAAKELNLPKPWHLLAHSMGGCIGLRAVLEGLPVTSSIFSAPMWGIYIADALRPVAWSLSWSSKQMGFGHLFAPGTASEAYVLTEPFETNKLTRDPEMYQYMIDHARAEPALGLGGPSLRWLHEALKETRALARLPSPNLPCLILMGSDEQIVDVPRIRARLANWPGAELELVEGGRHELLMESRTIRTHLTDTIAGFMADAADGNGGNGPSQPVRQVVAGGQSS